MLVAAIAVGGIVTALAGRWPVIEAPRAAPATVAEEIRAHPSLWRHLRRHYDPRTQTGIALTVASAVVVVGAVGVGVLLATVHRNVGIARWDGALAHFGADHATAWATRVLHAVSFCLGGTVGMVVLGMVALAVEMRRRPERVVPVFLVVIIGGQAVVCNVIKWFVDRARPDVLPLSDPFGSSFPSGHTTAAAASMAAFALLLGRGRSRRVKTVLAGVAAGIATAVAASRVFLGVHWLTDVLAGLALGWSWFALCSIAFGGRLLRFGLPAETAALPARPPDSIPTDS
ncbi:MAG: phosphatase PAP2 family protein [Ilumatobacteraceae bacterium]